MKKTLLALAVIAATGTAFAQSTVSLTGKFAAAYNTTAGANNVAGASGLGVTDGDVVFTAVEDLGGGMKAGATMAVKVRGRGPAGVVDGRDAIVYVGGNFGTVKIGAIEAGNGIIGLGGAGAPVIGLDGTALGISRSSIDGAANIDYLNYTSPSFSGFTVGWTNFDSVGAPAAGGAQNNANNPLMSGNTLALNYANGPIAANLDYTAFSFNATTNAAASDNRTRLSGSYDLGVVKLGAGYQSKNVRNVVAGVAGAADVRNTQYILGASVPLGAVTLGLNWTRNTQDLLNDVTGTDIGLNYALSKRTGVQVAYQTVTESNVTGSGTNFRIRLMHSF